MQEYLSQKQINIMSQEMPQNINQEIIKKKEIMNRELILEKAGITLKNLFPEPNNEEEENESADWLSTKNWPAPALSLSSLI